MCMTPDIDTPKPVEPPPPPAPPAPPATQTAAEKQSTPEKPDKAGGTKRQKGRNSLRIPRQGSRGLNLPGSGGGS